MHGMDTITRPAPTEPVAIIAQRLGRFMYAAQAVLGEREYARVQAEAVAAAEQTAAGVLTTLGMLEVADALRAAVFAEGTIIRVTSRDGHVIEGVYMSVAANGAIRILPDSGHVATVMTTYANGIDAVYDVEFVA